MEKRSENKARVAVIGIDQGTRSSRALVIDEQGNPLFSSRVDVALKEMGSGCVEQDLQELVVSVKEVLDQALRFAAEEQIAISAIGLATQRSGVCAWHRVTGMPAAPMLSWADTRTHRALEQLGDRRQLIRRKTSLPVLAHYAGGKIALRQSHFPDPDILVGTLDSFLLWHLSAERPFITDDSMAARTMLYALDSHHWDSELLKLFGVDGQRLPDISASIGEDQACFYGGIPITAHVGDQQAAVLSVQARDIDCLINFGSIASILVPTGSRRVESEGLVTSVLYSRACGKDRIFEYLIEGIVNASGGIVDYLIGEKGYVQDASQIDECCYRARAAGSDTQIFLPRGGSGSPEWRDNLPVIEVGSQPAEPDGHVRAAIENIGGFVVRQLGIFSQRGLLPKQPRIAVSGGLSHSQYLLEFIAECAQVTLYLNDSAEATAAGVAYAALRANAGSKHTGWSRPFSKMVSPGTGTDLRQRYQDWLKLCERGLHGK